MPCNWNALPNIDDSNSRLGGFPSFWEQEITLHNRRQSVSCLSAPGEETRPDRTELNRPLIKYPKLPCYADPKLGDRKRPTKWDFWPPPHWLQLFGWDLLSSVTFDVGVRLAPQLSGGFEYPRGVSFWGVAVWKISHSCGSRILPWFWQKRMQLSGSILNWIIVNTKCTKKCLN